MVKEKNDPNAENPSRSRKTFKFLSKIYEDGYKTSDKTEKYEDPKSVKWEGFRKYFDIALKKLQRGTFELIPLERYAKEDITAFIFELRVNRQTNTTLEYITQLKFNPEKYREYFEHPYLFHDLLGENAKVGFAEELTIQDMMAVCRGEQLTDWFKSLGSEVFAINFDEWPLSRVKEEMEEDYFFVNPKEEILRQYSPSIDKARLYWCEYLIWNSQIKRERELEEEVRKNLIMMFPQYASENQNEECDSIEGLKNDLKHRKLWTTFSDKKKAYCAANGNLDGFKECDKLFQVLCSIGASKWSAEKQPVTWAVLLAVVKEKKIKLKLPRDVLRYEDAIKGNVKNETRSNGSTRTEMTEYSVSQSAKHIVEYYQYTDTLVQEPFRQELVELSVYMDAVKVALICDEKTQCAFWEMYFYIKECLGKALLIYDEQRFRELVEWIGEGFYGENWLKN